MVTPPLASPSQRPWAKSVWGKGSHVRQLICATESIEGIISEAEDIMDDFKGSPALDAGLTSSAQAVEHYEIARYGTLHRWATELGMKDAAKLLDQTLQQEWKTDEDLTTLADKTVNDAAQKG